MSIYAYLMLFLGILLWWFLRMHASEAEVRKELERTGHRDINSKVDLWSSGRNSFYVAFDATDRDGNPVTGHAMKYLLRSVRLEFDLESERVTRLRRIAGGEADALELESDVGLEQRIRFETNQRLERLQGDREAFLANDLNGDGVVDGDELKLVRQRITAEVRAELTGQAPPMPKTPPVSTPASAREESIAEPEGDQPAVVEDGHW